jgi:hypothetical protein
MADVDSVLLLTLPTLLALAAVWLGRASREALPTDDEVTNAVEAERKRLGDQRLAPLRLWFASLVAKAVDLDGAVLPTDVTKTSVDLDLRDAGPGAGSDDGYPSILDVMERDDLAERAWVEQSLAIVRDEVKAQERLTDLQVPLRWCWVGHGRLVSTGWGLVSFHRAQLHLVNASDLGRQVVVEVRWLGGPGVGRRRSPMVSVAQAEEAVAAVRFLDAEVESSTSDPGDLEWMVEELMMREATQTATVGMRVSDAMIGAIHLSHDALRRRGHVGVFVDHDRATGHGAFSPRSATYRRTVAVDATHRHLSGVRTPWLPSDRAVGIRTR